ncbi:hypothetical protein [Hymenobacter sp. BT491]|uniref:hypothetical protein n=1 Tax=Hymenobacter sp. BT491 TaxID=2766779 RepID=UPI0016534B4E|nr:hypothetical protein [Hymenobacter sp. BT491]MBC6988958.1 hypothetical protein [Hymenobacter sp. BT491]
MLDPNAFHGAPRSFFTPQPQPARVVEVPPAPVLPPSDATLSVSLTRRVYLTTALLLYLDAQLKLAGLPLVKHGTTLDLLQPAKGRPYWVLDTQPNVGSPLTHTRHTRPVFTTNAHVSRQFLVGPGKNQHGAQKLDVRSTVKLSLLPDQPDAAKGQFRFAQPPRRRFS